jgi:hypothetical protein
LSSEPYKNWIAWFLNRRIKKTFLAFTERFLPQSKHLLTMINMKFLIIQKIKREVPIEKWAKLLPLQFKYFENLEKEKTLEITYHLIGQQGSMLIVNVDSDEKLSKIVGQDPMFFDSEREIYPLTTRQTHEKQIRELLRPEAAGF